MFESFSDLISILHAQNLAELPDARIEEDFAALHRAIERLEVERLRRLAEIDRRALHERDGHLSAVSWFASQHGVSRSSAAADVRTARAIEQMPRAREALHDGDLSIDAVKTLAAAQRFDGDAFTRSEALLVDAAKRHPTDDLQRVVAHWRHRVEQERADDGILRDGRGIHASVTFGGMVRVDGNLDPETGESLIAAGARRRRSRR